MKITIQKLFLTCIFTLLFSFLCINFLKIDVKAADSDWTYEAYGADGIKITAYSGSDTVIEIPETLDGKTVRCLGEALFFEKKTITKITVPSTVVDIERSVFYGCTALSEVDLPSGLTAISDYLFYNCRSLSSVTISVSVKSIGEMAFGSCYALNGITIPNGVTTIKKQAFSHCNSLTSITIPNSVTSMGYEAFSSCGALASVQISTGLESIPQSAFCDCDKLTSVVIPDNIITIERSAFSGCSQLNSVTLSKNLTSIGFYSFYWTAIKNIVIPDSVTSLDADAFSYSTQISEVTLPCLFTDYSGFPETANITTTHPQKGNTKATNTTNGLKKGCACGHTSDVVVYSPATIELAAGATPYYTGSEVKPAIVVKDTLGNVISSDNYTVEYSNNVDIGTANVTVTFKADSALYSGTLEGTFKIWNQASDFTTSINEARDKCTIEGYSGTSNIVIIPDKIDGVSVTEIKEYAFYERDGLESISIPESVTTIGEAAFLGCTSLTSIKIPIGVTSIEGSTFSGCISLTSISIPNSVTTIKGSAFLGCRSLTSISIPNGVTTIKSYAFRDCGGLTSITIPSSVTSIETEAFYYCYNLTNITIDEENTNYKTSTDHKCILSYDGKTLLFYPYTTGSVTIPNTITTIGEKAFFNHMGLSSITIPDSVTSIELEAFSGCVNLTTIRFEGRTLPTFGRNVFLFINVEGTIYVPAIMSSEELQNFLDDEIIFEDWNLERYRFTTSEKDIQYNSTTATYSAKTTSLGTVTTYYYVNGAWTTTKPTAGGTYNVGFTIAQNDYYEVFGSSSDVKTETPVKTCFVKYTPIASDFSYNSTTGVITAATGKQLGTVTTYYKVNNSWTTTKPTTEGTYEVGVVATGSSVYEAIGSATAPITNSNWKYNIPHTHTFETTWTTDGTYHWHKCKTCPTTTEKIKHSGGTATCTTKAKCAICGVSYGELKSHVYTNVVTKATLSADGTIVNKCSCGKIASTTYIKKPASFTLSKTSFVYTGSQLKPTVVVKDSAGKVIAATNYTITYGTNKAVGTGTVKITFKGNYSGTKTLTFKINPKATGIASLSNASTGIVIKWAKNTTATGYKLYRSTDGKKYTLIKTIGVNTTVSYTDTGAKSNGTKYYYKIIAYKKVGTSVYNATTSVAKAYYRLTTPKVTATNSAVCKVTVKWNKNAKATGYLIKYTVGTTTKTIKITSAASVRKVISSLSKGKTYKISVQAYKMVGKTAYYSGWSAVKSVKIVK